METAIYKEQQPMQFRYPLALMGVGVMLFGAWKVRHDDPLSSFIMIVIAGVFALVFWGFTEFTVVVTPTELRFGFPLFRKHFPLSEIEVGDTQRIALLAGIGIHRWAGKWVYNARYGEGVNIARGRQHYLLGSRHPVELQHKLLESAPHKPEQR